MTEARGWLALAVCGLWIVFISLCLGLIFVVWAATESTPKRLPHLTLLPPTGPDTQPPVLLIKTPADGATVAPKSTVLVVVQASDNVAITRLGVTVSDPDSAVSQSVCVLFEPPYECIWKVPGKANQRYTIRAQAMDATGNNALAQTEVLAK